MLIPNIYHYIGFSVVVKTLLNFIKFLYKILQSDFIFFGLKRVIFLSAKIEINKNELNLINLGGLEALKRQ